jgi:hypothetical protein
MLSRAAPNPPRGEDTGDFFAEPTIFLLFPDDRGGLKIREPLLTIITVWRYGGAKQVF